MMISLDTHAVIAILNSKVSPVRSHLAAAHRHHRTIAVSAVVLFELRYGAAKSGNPQRNLQRIADFMSGPFERLALEPEDAEEAGDIRAVLERAGTPIGPYDVLIAGQARRRGATVATANLAEFTRVPGLRVEAWT